MKRDLKELIQELLDHIDENPLTDEQIEKIEKWIEDRNNNCSDSQLSN
ncbi:colicin immunity protein [Streptococcus lutetiensis]|nr:colicin immunity protein [Streptococcus lutetiensis]MBT0927821.1 colicin immunity protein [Streptococcus lutetiensis]